ncbi:MAG: hypothetical protein IIZ61_03125 [Lachnospiraceae bacterium]|nr:hypothetical protein [Lachnospiraceae bacterium]
MNRLYIKKSHIIFEIISYAILLASVIYAVIMILRYGNSDFPTRFSGGGEVTGYGSAYVLLIIPGTMLITNILLSLSLHLFPVKLWNMPFKVKPGREIPVYASMASMMVSLELMMSVYSLATTIAWANFRDDLIMLYSFGIAGLTLVDCIFFILQGANRNK